MNGRHARVSAGLTMAAGVLLGWGLAASRPAPLWAGGGDHSGGDVLVTGPVSIGYDEATRSPIPVEAVYYLDIRGARLLASVPSYQLVGGKAQYLGGFAERDLYADFKLDEADRHGPPRFLMTTGSLGQFTSGCAPLYVVEAATNQVAVYKIQNEIRAGTGNAPRLDLVQLLRLPPVRFAPFGASANGR